MTPYERLMSEAIPTGHFGYPPPPSNPHTRPWTALEQAEHRRILDEALNGWHDTSNHATRDRQRPRPLRLVQPPPTPPDHHRARPRDHHTPRPNPPPPHPRKAHPMTTPPLFDAEPTPTALGSAILSDCDRYRYLLGREWADDKPTAVFVMLNPSTADALRDDPTIRRCLGYARSWGCGALMVANLYAWRATDPAELWTADDPVGPENDAHLYAAATIAAESGGPLVGAWGANAREDRIAAVLALPGMDRLAALDVTRAGQPRHPLYLKVGLTPQPWAPPAA